MGETNTVKLLKECDSGVKMAIASIEDLGEKAKASDLKQILSKSKEEHKKIEGDICCALRENGAQEKEPGMMARGMSWAKSNMKMAMDASDATVAGLVTDGCDMGVKSLTQFMNEYEDADKKSKDLCKELISLEEKLEKDMRAYL